MNRSASEGENGPHGRRALTSVSKARARSLPGGDVLLKREPRSTDGPENEVDGVQKYVRQAPSKTTMGSPALFQASCASVDYLR